MEPSRRFHSPAGAFYSGRPVWPFGVAVSRVDIQDKKTQSCIFFAPKLAHKWAQTVGARTEYAALPFYVLECSNTRKGYAKWPYRFVPFIEKLLAACLSESSHFQTDTARSAGQMAIQVCFGDRKGSLR